MSNGIDLDLLGHDMRGLQARVSSLESRYIRLDDRDDEAERDRNELAGQAEVLQQRTSGTEEALEKIGAELADLRQDIIKLAGRVSLLESHVHAGGSTPRAGLSSLPGAKDLTALIRKADGARATLLSDTDRAAATAEITGYEQLRQLQQGHLAAALQHSKTIAGTGPADPARRPAEAGLRDTRTQQRALALRLRQQQPACEEAHAALAADGQRRAQAGPVIMDGERARAMLRSRARASISTAVEQRAVLPVWFTRLAGYEPPTDGCEDWLEAAADLVAYRAAYGITDAVNGLGPQADQSDDPARYQWRSDLERKLEQARQLR